MEVGRRGIAHRRPVYIPWRRVFKNGSWDAHIINKVIEKSKTQICKMGVILRESQLDTRIKIYILRNVIVPKLEYAREVWEGNAKLVKKLETVPMTAAKKILGCSKTATNYTALRAGLSMYSLKTET